MPFSSADSRRTNTQRVGESAGLIDILIRSAVALWLGRKPVYIQKQTHTHTHRECVSSPVFWLMVASQSRKQCTDCDANSATLYAASFLVFFSPPVRLDDNNPRELVFITRCVRATRAPPRMLLLWSQRSTQRVKPHHTNIH